MVTTFIVGFAGLVIGFAVGFYLGVAYGAPAWLDWAAEQRKRQSHR